MMNAEQLSRVGEKLVKRCGSRDPFEIARQLGINVMLCESFGSLKGMYRVIKRNRFIFLNNSLDENMLRIVCAHELGHDQLHRNMAKTTPIHEFMLYDMKSKPEHEANIVAAEILMDSDEVLRYIYEYGYTAEQIASAMSTDINLVALNVAHLATLGFEITYLRGALIGSPFLLQIVQMPSAQLFPELLLCIIDPQLLQIFSGRHSIHMKAFPVMLIHLFLCHLRNLPDFLLMTLGCASSVLSAHSSKKAGL